MVRSRRPSARATSFEVRSTQQQFANCQLQLGALRERLAVAPRDRRYSATKTRRTASQFARYRQTRSPAVVTRRFRPLRRNLKPKVFTHTAKWRWTRARTHTHTHRRAFISPTQLTHASTDGFRPLYVCVCVIACDARYIQFCWACVGLYTSVCSSTFMYKCVGVFCVQNSTQDALRQNFRFVYVFLSTYFSYLNFSFLYQIGTAF